MKKLTLLLALTMILFSCKPEAEKPTVVTKSVGEVTETTAKVVGQVTADGGAEVTERGVCWNTAPAPEVIDYRTVDGTGVGTFNSNISDLVPNTQYYVRAYATNEMGTSYGDEKSFTTLEVIPEEPEEPEGPEGPENPEQPEDPEQPEEPENPEQPEDPENPEQPEDPENPEQPEDPENPEQPEEPENPEQPVGPVVITAEVTDITVNSAVCGGGISDGGGAAVVERGVCWNASGNPTVLDFCVKDTEGGLGTYISNITDLEHNTTYYVRAYAVNANGVAGYGPEVSFITLEKLLPTVTTATEVANITVSTAKCGGKVVSDGGGEVTARGICWSTKQNPTLEDNKTTNGRGVGSYTSNMTNLEHNTTYYVRAYATNEVGTAYGEEVTFTTLEKLLPTVITTEVTGITVTSAKCVGEVTFNGNVSVTARGICWSTSQNPTIEDNKMTNGSGIGSYTSNMTNLEHNTTYYVRAYATNEVGTAYGEEVSFTTKDVPAVAVDLGLSVKWATCNVGATSPEEYGDYFAWGETATKAEYTDENSSTYRLSTSKLQSQGYIDSEGNLTSQYDAATANWGGDWRMPTVDELNELRTKCTWTWTTHNGVNGYKVTGPSGASIFLPAAGYRNGSSLDDAGSDGNYWSSTPFDYYGDDGAYYLYFFSSHHDISLSDRYYGLSVRSVLE